MAIRKQPPSPADVETRFRQSAPASTKQIRGNTGDPASWGRFDPVFHLCFDLLKATRYQLLTCIPELTPVYRRCPFHEVGEKDHAVISGGDYTWYRRKVAPDGPSSWHSVKSYVSWLVQTGGIDRHKDDREGEDMSLVPLGV